MIVNHEARYLFVEPPFTGSTAIATELQEHYGGERIYWKHEKYIRFRAEHGRRADDYFVFATNRNPLDQAVSEYLKLKNNHRGNFTTPAKFARNGGYITEKTLEEFHWVQANDASFDDYFLRYKSGLFNNWYLLGHERFDAILDFSSLADDFDDVLRRIGFEPVRKLPLVNPTKGKRAWDEYFTPEAREQAFLAYGPYMRKWGFEFPAAWGPPRIPWTARARFRAVDAGVRLVTRYVRLDSGSEVVQRVKRLAQRSAR